MVVGPTTAPLAKRPLIDRPLARGPKDYSPDHLGISASGHDDIYNVRGMPSDMIFMGVSGNAGNDIFNVGSLNNTLDQIGSVVVGDTGGGFDQLNINDQGNLTPSNYNISDFEVNRATPRFSICLLYTSDAADE